MLTLCVVVFLSRINIKVKFTFDWAAGEAPSHKNSLIKLRLSYLHAIWRAVSPISSVMLTSAPDFNSISAHFSESEK